MNRLMVKPTPHSTHTPKNCRQLASAGSFAPAMRISSQDAPNTPTALPTSKPAGDAQRHGLEQRRDTHALPATRRH